MNRFIPFLIPFAFMASGCCLMPSSDYGQLRIRSLDSTTGTAISASAISACDGQSLGDTLTDISFKRDTYWYPGKVMSIVVSAPGYEPVWQTITIDKWSKSPADARLNENLMVVKLRPITGFTKGDK